MSTEPSLGAKQTARERGFAVIGHKADPYDAFCEGYDTATAKAREEWEQEHNVCADALARLAHQQPSHCQHFFGTHTDRQCNRPAIEYCQEHYEAHQQPSAPTADVEKIARDAAHNIDTRLPYGFTNVETDMVEDEVRNALAQARAPLVAALERMFQCHILYCAQCSGPDDGCDQGARLEEIKLAALTGTGEKPK